MRYNPRANAKMGKRNSFYVGLAKLKECKPRAPRERSTWRKPT